MTKDNDIQLAELKIQMEQNSKEHLEIKEILCEIKKDFKDWKVEADSKYAPKWVANFLYFLIAGGTLYIMQLIIKDLVK